MTHTVFIDGAAGTTGLEIVERLAPRSEFDLLILDDEQRKSAEARREAYHSADFAVLCLPDEAAIEAELYTHDLPPLDLMIRTSGEVRLSNFMLWQAAYAELLFVDTLWPDFDGDALTEAVAAFGQRQRRFGGL